MLIEDRSMSILMLLLSLLSSCRWYSLLFMFNLLGLSYSVDVESGDVACIH